MTPPLARMTPDDIDWIIEQLTKKVKKVEERIEFDDRIRKNEREKAAADGYERPIESMDDIDRYVMEGLGYDMAKIEAMVQQLSPEQASMLEDIDFSGRAGITAEEMAQELSGVPGLTDGQVKTLVGMEMKLLRDEKLKGLTGM